MKASCHLKVVCALAGMCVLAVSAIEASAEGDLPAGYTSVEYIQGDGSTSFVTTDFIPNPQTDKVVFELARKDYSKTMFAFCARKKSKSASWSVNLRMDGTYRFDYNGTETFSTTPKDELGVKYTYEVDNNVATRSGGVSVTATQDAAFTVAGSAFWLFRAPDNLDSVGNFKLYSFKVYRGGVLVHDLVPAKDPQGKPVFVDVVGTMSITMNGTFIVPAAESGEGGGDGGGEVSKRGLVAFTCGGMAWWDAGLTPVQRRFLAAPRSERERIMADADARVELARDTRYEIDGVFNFRDLGGRRRGLGGRRIRSGCLYRSARFDEVTDKGRQELVGKLGIRTDLDLRGDSEVTALGEKSPLGSTVVWKLSPIPSAYDMANTSSGKQALRLALTEVFNRENWPLAFHCKTGKDRTGMLAFVILALLGVEEDEICLDWERTAFHVPELSRMDHPTRYDVMLAYFMSLPGESLTEKVEGYVLSLGFTSEEIAEFRDQMLVH